MPAKVIPITDLAKAIDEALLKVAVKGKPGGPIILGRMIKDFKGDAAAVAKKVTAEVAPKLQGMKLTPTTIPGKDGTTIGFIIRPPVGPIGK